jgi:hypothetical protein
MELHEIKNFCTAKEIVTKLKSLPTEWEIIFSSYTSDKRLITKYTGAQNTKLPKKSMTQ